VNPGRAALLEGLLESPFREQVRVWAERRGWLVYFTWSSRHSPAGFPDLVLVRPPRLIFAELKTQRAPPPRGLQEQWLAALRGVPAIEVYLWRPLDEDAILAALR
jgi:hypothetical protein